MFARFPGTSAALPAAFGASRPPGPRHFEAVPLSRIAWLVTVAASFVVALLLLVSDYNGYALLAVAVGLSAAINLR